MRVRSAIGAACRFLSPAWRKLPAPAGRPGLLLLVVLAVLGTALVAVVAWGAVLLVHDRQASDARRSALAQAGPLTTRILSYDYRSLDTDLSLARADTTGQFRQQFTDLTMRAVAPTARAQHVVTQANVTAVGVMDAKPDHAVALVFLNQTTSSTQLPSPEIAESRVRLELTKVGGQWLVSDLAPL